MDLENVVPGTKKRYATRAATRRALADIVNRPILPLGEKRTLKSVKSEPTKQDDSKQQDVPTPKPKTYILEKEKLPHGVEDIDAKDKFDTLTEYSHAVNVHKALLLRESTACVPSSDYLDGREITGHMRRILVDWLVDVHGQYGLSSTTLHITVNIMDRFLACSEIAKSKLQLVGISCAWIASKYEEVYPPSIADFVYISDGTYTSEQVECMEANILSGINWRLTVATMPPFAARALKALRIEDSNMSYLTNYMLELALCDITCLDWTPSRIAAAAVALAAHLLSPVELIWDSTMRFHTGGYDIVGLSDCIYHIWSLVQRDARKGSSLDAVNRKYSSSRFGRIAQVAATLEFDVINCNSN